MIVRVVEIGLGLSVVVWESVVCGIRLGEGMSGDGGYSRVGVREEGVKCWNIDWCLRMN